jgi:2,3-bisphosphoglycerate-dependent phosphoglycerate mutase
VSVPPVERLILVRHAMPELDPAVPAERWHLGPEGRAAARSLRALMPEPGYYVASDEPKATETLQEVAGFGEVATDRGFGEVRRPHVWSDDYDYRTVARAYVEGVDHAGWEPRDQVVNRFGAAVARHAALASARNQTLVIGTHGLAPTVWLATVLPLDPSPAQFWAALGFPDVIDVDLAGRTASRRPGATC